ncbi:dehydrogenase [Rubellimicrobium mesophilum DSM 19309]|uniref:Dehydrogenase n=1 Tax=Rubellimicrobium mesophilum DSM 19309 TaxID=442562 RepID=A0A017HTJ5_9RHOB|nr:cation:proton antiporter subunit C [Rubellimicrobium mesophilum]EYD77716.1 dehydrogenase [Rubellimicrobium mesophilum DSM 19309]
MSVLPYLIAGWLFVIGLYGVVSSRNYMHLIGCLTVIQSSTYVLLLAIGYHEGRPAPIFSDHPSGPAVDPVVQALVLTDVVVGAAVSALLLTLVLQLKKRRGTLDPDELSPERD